MLITIFFVSFSTYAELDVFGHGVGPRFNAGFYRVENTSYSETTIDVGESFFLNGTLVSLVEKDIAGTMDIRFDYANNDPWFVNLLKSNFSCRVKDTCAKSIHVFPNQNHWYMDVRPTPDSYVLKGNDVMPYSLEMTPLKSGIYHIHTDPNADIEIHRHLVQVRH